MSQYSVDWHAKLNSSSGTVAVGKCLVRATDGTHYVGTTANRTTYGRCVGIASTAGDSATPVVVMIETGIVPAAITGLAVGTVSWVRVSSSGTLERVTPGSGDDIIGKAHADGSVQLQPGTWDSANYAGGGGGGSVPTGTGIPHIVSGAQDAAASLIVNADVHASAAIAASKVVQATGTGIPHVVGGALSAASSLIVNADVDAAAAIAASKVVQATGTGIPHVVAGALAAASSLIVNADVDAGAAIAISKLAAIAASDIASGTLVHERGGLEADVSAYSGLVKITGGATSAVTLAANVETLLTTPSSANLAAAVTDETGTGALVFANTPTLVTPVIGAATGTSLTTTGKVTAGALAIAPRVTNATTGNQDNIPCGPVIALTDGINIRGILATGVTDGQIIYLLAPALATGITILHQDANSTAANRIITWNAGTINLYENSYTGLIYDGTAQRWKFMKEGF
jgi:hypothetical protein